MSVFPVRTAASFKTQLDLLLFRLNHRGWLALMYVLIEFISAYYSVSPFLLSYSKYLSSLLEQPRLGISSDVAAFVAAF